MSADFEYTRRLTIDGMSDVYTSEIAYICSQPANNTLWWSLTSHFAWLRTRGFAMPAKAFFKMFRRDIATSLDSDSYKPRVADTPKHSVLPVCTTLVLVSSLWHTAAHTRTPALHGVTLGQYWDRGAWNWPSSYSRDYIYIYCGGATLPYHILSYHHSLGSRFRGSNSASDRSSSGSNSHRCTSG